MACDVEHLAASLYLEGVATRLASWAAGSWRIGRWDRKGGCAYGVGYAWFRGSRDLGRSDRVCRALV